MRKLAVPMGEMVVCRPRVLGGRAAGRACGGRALLVACVLVMAGCLAPSVARASALLRWGSPWLVDSRATAHVGGLGAVTCAAGPVCVAAGGRDLVVSRDPAGGRRAWRRFMLPKTVVTPAGLSCRSRALCVGVAGGEVISSGDPTGRASAWRAVSVPARLASVSCATVRLCVAAGGSGRVTLSTTPTARTSGSWSTYTVPTSVPSECGKDGPGSDCVADLTGISCPTASLCVAVDSADNSEGDVIVSTDPTGGASTWKFARIDTANGFSDVSCPTASLCVAVDFAGNRYVSQRPAGEAGAWRFTRARFPANIGESLPQVSCGSTKLCVETVGDAANVSATPAARSPWLLTRIIPPRNQGVQSISCAKPALCVAADDSGHVVVGTPARRARRRRQS